MSLVSHSLGGRLVLEAAKHLTRPAHEVCLLAAAVDDDCLSTKQYAAARERTGRISVLASQKDTVLRLSYPVGDFFSDLFYDDDSPARKALGYHGPHPRSLERVQHAQIPPGEKYGHGDYMPPSDLNVQNPKAAKPRQFVAEALQGLPHAWP